MKRSFRILLVILIVVSAGVLGYAVYRVQHNADEEVIPEAGSSFHADHSSEYLTYQEKDYPVIRRMSSLLLIGTDNYIDDAKQFEEDFYYNRNLADFLVVLIFNHDEKTVTPLQINRDTIAWVPALSFNGMKNGYGLKQITYAHMYGSGKEDSCRNTVDAVRTLIYNAPIDHFMAFTMDAVPLVNDLVGGVTVTLEEDLPSLGKEYVKGASVILKGSAALRFVRTRDTSLLDSNVSRMSRQRLYLSAFTEAARTAAANNEELALDAFKVVNPFLCTDLTVNAISDILDDLIAYEIKPVLSPDGEYIMGEKYAEFYVDDSSLWQCVSSAFCKKA